MTRQLHLPSSSRLWLAVLVLIGSVANAQSAPADDERAIRQVLARFYDGWNAHDVERMTSVYSDDVDHINVFGEWHKGKTEISEDLRLLHTNRKLRPDGTPAPAGTKNHTVEKVRFLKPDVAVVQVRSLSPGGGNLGTYVMSKTSGTWLVVSFTNVGYQPKPDR